MGECVPFQILQITDGTTTVDFLNEHSGFFVSDWTQNIAPVKNDGVWSDSPLTDGRKLRMKRYNNATQTWEIQLRDWNPDALIRDTRNLRQLLEKAAAYSASRWQKDEVWIKRQGLLESNPTYALIEDYRALADGYPFSNQDLFWNKLGQSAFPDWSLTLEHEPFWRSVPPGQPCPEEKSESISGCFPNYLEFDAANSVVDCGSDASIDDLPNGGAITFDMWAKPTSYGEGNTGYFARKGAGWIIWFTGGNLQFVVYSAGGNSTAQVAYVIDSSWHHFAFTYDDTGAKTAQIWIDGVLSATGGALGGAYTADAAANLFIGASNAGAANSFGGDIGWCRYSDTQRWAANFTRPGRCTLPAIDANTMLQVIYEGTGATTADMSGNDNDGDITSAEWACDCDYTDSDDVECNCVQSSGTQEDWRYEELFAIHDANPVGQVHDIIETDSGILVACESSSNVWRSLDGTAPWAACAVPPAPNVNCQVMLEVVADGAIYLLGTDTGTTLVECWRSVDDGNNWALRNNDITGAGSATFADQNGLAYFNSYLYAAVRGPNTGGVYRSNDGGTTWTRVFSTPLGGCVALFVWDDVLYTSSGVGSDVGSIWRSTDGTTWAKVFVTDDRSYITVFQEIDDKLFASELVGTLDGPRLYSTSDGLNWGRVTSNDTLFGVVYGNDIQQIASGNYLMSGSGGNVYESITGIDWKAIDTIGAPPAEGMVGNYSGNGLAYLGGNGNIYILSNSTDVGRDATCLDEVFVANKKNIAQVTNVFVYNASTATYTSQFPAAALPYLLLPAPFVAGDIAYFGIAQNASDSGPFCSLIFDIYQELNGATITIVWEYSQGGAAWATLNVQDGTMAIDPFDKLGVNAIVWVPPDDWAVDAIGPGAGVTGLWVRARITAVGTWLQSPMQGNRDIYTVTWPDVDIDDAQVGGDVPALLRVEAHNRSDENAYTVVDELDLMTNRLIVGLRSTFRGDQFTSFINLAEDGVVANTYSQNPIGVSVVDGTGTTTAADQRAPCGIACVHTTPPTGSLYVYADAATVYFGPSIAQDFYGTFHAFLRAQLEETATSPNISEGAVHVRLKYQTGTGGVSEVSKYTTFTGFDANGEHYKDYALLDFGRITLPVSGAFDSDELPDEFSITVQISSEALAYGLVTLYDIILIPADEWSGDFVDDALEDDSGVSNGFELDMDSVTFPRQALRSIVRTADASGFIKSVYERVGIGPAVLQANADQRLYFMSARGLAWGYHVGANNQPILADPYNDFLTAGVQAGMTVYNVTDGSSATITVVDAIYVQGTLAGGVDNDWDTNDVYLIVCGNWRSEPQVVHSVKLQHVARYLSMRGND